MSHMRMVRTTVLCHLYPKEAVVVLLSLLSGLDESDTKQYFKKYLKNGKATVIVNTGKKFEFI